MYRDERYAARCRTRHVEGQLSELPRALHRMYACRQARIWAAGAGLAGFAAVLIDVLFGAKHLTQILIATWSAVAITSGVAWLAAGEVLRRRTLHTFAPTGDPLVDLMKLESGGARAYATERVKQLERLSLLLPLVCLSLLTPLTLHLLVGVTLLGVSVEKFNSWILLSLVLVGHAHAGLVVFSIHHITAVQRALDHGAPVLGGSRGALALLWTVSLSAVPGAVLLFIPPVLVATTGAVFVPGMFHWAAWRARAEREALATSLAAESTD